MSYSPLPNEPGDASAPTLPPSSPPSFGRAQRVWQHLDHWRDALTGPGGLWEATRRHPKAWLSEEPERRVCGVLSPRQLAAGGVVLLLLALVSWGRRSGHRIERIGEGAHWTYPGRPPKLLRHHAGDTFLDGFTFFVEPDPTHGTVTFQNASSAADDRLAYTSPHGTTILTIDPVATLELGEPRKSVRIHSRETVSTGSLILMDMAHAPIGCSVWPSFWMYGPFWPHSGEIDVYEGVNFRGKNLFSLHTAKGCLRTSVEQLGSKTDNTDCNADPLTGGDFNGCSVLDDEGSLGARFNQGGGGVFATMIAEEGIFIWRWGRDLIPPDIVDVKTHKPDPSTWGPPVASWLRESCDVPKYFKNMNLIFDITTCGDWAGNTGVWTAHRNARCSVNFPTCDHAVMEPRNFDDAFFDVNYLSVYKL